MVAQFVAFCCNSLHNALGVPNPVAHQEEGGLYIVFLESVQKLRGFASARAIIEGQGNLHQVAYLYLTGGRYPAVLSGTGDGHRTIGYAPHHAVAVHRGNGRIGGSPLQGLPGVLGITLGGQSFGCSRLQLHGAGIQGDFLQQGHYLHRHAGRSAVIQGNRHSGSSHPYGLDCPGSIHRYHLGVGGTEFGCGIHRVTVFQAQLLGGAGVQNQRLLGK